MCTTIAIVSEQVPMFSTRMACVAFVGNDCKMKQAAKSQHHLMGGMKTQMVMKLWSEFILTTFSTV